MRLSKLSRARRRRTTSLVLTGVTLALLVGVAPAARAARTLAPKITFQNTSYTVNEDDTANVRLLRTGDLSNENDVICQASSGTATENVDFKAPITPTVFLPGQKFSNCVVPIINDGVDEPNESLSLTLSGPYTQKKVVATLWILDEDLAGALRVNDPAPVNEGAANAAVSFTVTLDVGPAGHGAPVTVAYNTAFDPVATDPATAGAACSAPNVIGPDYRTTSGTLTFPARSHGQDRAGPGVP